MKTIVTLILAWTIAASAGAEPNCQPSRWGAEDEIGNANLISPQSVLAASQLVKTGKTYSLGITIDSNTPAFPPRSLSLHVVQPGQQFGRQAFPNSTYNDDVFIGWLGIGSQLDGLGHIGGSDGTYYNCFDGKEIAQLTGLTKLGTHNVPPIVARGIVLDMAAHRGVAHMQAGEVFTAEDVKAVEKKQGTPVRQGRRRVVPHRLGRTPSWKPTPRRGSAPSRASTRAWRATSRARTWWPSVRTPGAWTWCPPSTRTRPSRGTWYYSRKTVSTSWRP